MGKTTAKVKPYDSDNGKKQQVEKMFDNIAGKYDFLNHFLSLGIDKAWRKNLVKLLIKENPEKILDVATGTADLAIQISRAIPSAKITGLDISRGMLDIGIQKLRRKKLVDKIKLIQADSENIPFDNEYFDAVTVAFGVRNFESLIDGLKEMNRVLRPGGKVYILEFSKPKSKIFAIVFNLYFKYILPLIGRVTSKDPKAYSYLFESVQVFPSYEGFLKIMQDAGFKSNKYKIQTLGICSIYIGKK